MSASEWKYRISDEVEADFEAHGISRAEVDNVLRSDVSDPVWFGDSLVFIIGYTGRLFIVVRCDVPIRGLMFGVVTEVRVWKE